MADTPNTAQSNTPNFAPPTKTVVITGERVARIFQLTTRVSRMEQRFVGLSMARPAISDKARRAMDRFNHAATQFASEIEQIEKELEAAGRPDAQNAGGRGQRGGARRGGGGNTQQQPQKQPAKAKQQKPAGQQQDQRPQPNGKDEASPAAKQTGNQQQQPKSQQPSGQQPRRQQQNQQPGKAADTAAPVAETAATAAPSAAADNPAPVVESPAATPAPASLQAL